MSQVGQTGSTQNVPVDYSSQAESAKELESLEKVGSGSLDSQNIRLADQKNRNDLLRGQQIRAPELEHPDDVKPTSLEAANADIGEVSEITDKVAKSIHSLIENGRAGTLTPEQQARLEEHADTLEGAANYLNSIQGKGVGTAEGKRSVLAGLGFNQSQQEALLSLADPDDAGNSLASLHGGQGALQGKQSALKSIGFSESQIEAILSLANPDDDGSALASLHQGSPNPKGALQALGFSAGQADRLLSLLNGQQTRGNAEQRQLLSKLGFSDAEIEVLLATADSKLLKQQDVLAKTISSQQISQLQAQGKAVGAFSTGSNAGDVHIKQLVDIFAVLELLHEMSVQSRRIARESRSAEYDAAKQEILNQAQEMRNAAKSRLIGGIVSGTVKIAAGGITAGGAAGAKGNAPKGADASAKANAKAAATQAKIGRANAIAQGLNGAGEVASAGFNYQASLHDAQQKEHEAYQKTHENRAQAESEWMQLQQDMVKTVQSKMDEIIRTTFETLKSLTRG